MMGKGDYLMERSVYIISSPTCVKCKDLDTILTRRQVPHEKLDAESEQGKYYVEKHGIEYVGVMVLNEGSESRVITMKDINELYPKS